MKNKAPYDVAILGGGLAGLSLARQLLLHTEARVLLVEKRQAIPPKNQKVGESTVQLGGYYLSKVLELEEELLQHHYMKYNLRFYWKNADGKSFEDFSQAYIRKFSNIASYQINRNKLEATLLTLNQQSERFTLRLGETADVTIGPPHSLRFSDNTVASSRWVVDATGRQAFLSRQAKNEAPSPTHHGASFAWVEGLVDIDRLNGLSNRENRTKLRRRQTGHLPFWLATNHFMGKGFWFWVIPLQGITSLGVVYDKTCLNHTDVNTPEKLLTWAASEFPLFAKDFSSRRVLGGTSLKETGIGRKQVIHPSGWAMTGDAGRFLDPLYSPGTDFIAIQNTLITAAVKTPPAELPKFSLLSEALAKAYFDAFVPGFHTSYNALGEQESFVLKYTWELSVYFTFYVFPYINDLTAKSDFILPFLKRFAELGPINHSLHDWLSAFYEWKTANERASEEPHAHELMDLSPLADAEGLFYEVGHDEKDALALLDNHLTQLKDFARFLFAYMGARVAGDPQLARNAFFVRALGSGKEPCDVTRLRSIADQSRAHPEIHEWAFDYSCLSVFSSPAKKRKAA